MGCKRFSQEKIISPLPSDSYIHGPSIYSLPFPSLHCTSSDFPLPSKAKLLTDRVTVELSHGCRRKSRRRGVPPGPRPRGRGGGRRRDGELPGAGAGAGGGLHGGGAEAVGLPGLRDDGQVGAEPAVQAVLRGGEERAQGQRRRGLPLRRLLLQDAAPPDQRHPRLPPPRRLRRRRLRLQQVPRTGTIAVHGPGDTVRQRRCGSGTAEGRRRSEVSDGIDHRRARRRSCGSSSARLLSLLMEESFHSFITCYSLSL
uniref:Uncharacterized protein n=1 Tax=Oryza punctata TaxID=4537 RepID=A0A0E0KEF6_ORYPU